MAHEIELLEEIRSLLTVLTVLVGIYVLGHVIKYLCGLTRRLTRIKESAFDAFADWKFERRDYEGLVRICKEKIAGDMGIERAYWHLGRAYFALERLDDAEATFIQLTGLAPMWEEEYIRPYLKAIAIKKTPASSVVGNVPSTTDVQNPN